MKFGEKFDCFLSYWIPDIKIELSFPTENALDSGWY